MNTKSLNLNAWKLWRRNGMIWAALMILLALTLALAYVPMGLLTPTVGIVIAFAKAGLVIMLFMELAESQALIRLAAMAGFVFLMIFFALTLSDVLRVLLAAEQGLLPVTTRLYNQLAHQTCLGG